MAPYGRPRGNRLTNVRQLSGVGGGSEAWSYRRAVNVLWGQWAGVRRDTLLISGDKGHCGFAQKNWHRALSNEQKRTVNKWFPHESLGHMIGLNENCKDETDHGAFSLALAA